MEVVHLGVSYSKLRELLIKYNIKIYEMQQHTKLSNGLLAKINKNEYIQLDKLELICEYIEKRIEEETGEKVFLDFSDIMERV